MIYQYKKMTSPQKTEEVTPTSSILSASKFQRTAKRAITTPEETNANSQKTQSVITQQIRQTPIYERPKVLSRTNKLTEKRQSNKSLISQEPQSISIKSRSPQTQSTKNIALKQAQSFVSKIQEPPATNIKNQQTKQVQEIKSISLKKSQAIMHLICRLKKNTMISVFAKLYQNKKQRKIKNDIQAKLLILTSSQLARKFEVNFYQEFMDKLKIMYSKKSQQNSKIEVQNFQTNLKKKKENLINLLNIISKLKLKEFVDKLKLKTYIKNNILRAAPTLIDFYQKRKIREAFMLLKQASLLSSLNRKSKLTSVSNISKYCEKQQFKKVFIKLHLWTSCQKPLQKELYKEKSAKSIQIPSVNVDKNNQQSNNKIQKIKKQNEKNEKEIAALQLKLKKLKKDIENEKKPFQKNIEDLQSQKKKNQKEIEQKKNVNNQLKSQIESNAKIQNTLLPPENDDRIANDKLANLQKIYFMLSRSLDEDLALQINFLQRQMKINTSSSFKTIDDWQLILKKSQLQREINIYENAIIGQSSVSKQQNSITKLVQEQNDMLKTMIRNYIKQRYLWTEVQKFLTSMA